MAEEARDAGNPMIWDVVEQWLKAQPGGRVTPRRPNLPGLIGMDGNPGVT